MMNHLQSASGTDNKIQKPREHRATTTAMRPDIVCIGFGSSSISLAIALQEISPDTKVLFLEQQSRSTYVPFTRLPGSFMQLSFLNDLVTLENPRSKFSYIQYLHSTSQLIRFTNLGSMQPLREQFAGYLGWCADQFEHNVRYGSKVQAVRPAKADKESLVNGWNVEYVDVESNELRSISAKQVVCAVGLQPSIPDLLQNTDVSNSVLHSSECLEFLHNVAKDLTNQYCFVVLGNGQEAAEITERICSMRNSHQVTWIQRSSPRGSDKVDSALDHRLYELHYTQKVTDPNPQGWAFQKHSDVDLKSVHRNADGRIHIAYKAMEVSSRSMGTVCDFVIAATGYKKLEYKKILGQVKELFYGDEFSIDRYNSVRLKQMDVQKNCGLWVLGTLASVTDHGDNSFASMASRSRNLADSLVKRLQMSSSTSEQLQAQL